MSAQAWALSRVQAWLARAEGAEASLVHVGVATVEAATPPAPDEAARGATRSVYFVIHDGAAHDAGVPGRDDDPPAFVRTRPMGPRPLSDDAPFEDAVVRALGKLLKTTRWVLAAWPLDPALDTHEDAASTGSLARTDLAPLAAMLAGTEHVAALHGWVREAGAEPRARWYALRDPRVEGSGHGGHALAGDRATGVLLSIDGEAELWTPQSRAPAAKTTTTSAPAQAAHSDAARADAAKARAALAAVGYAWSVQRNARLAVYDELVFGAPTTGPGARPLQEVGLSRDAIARRDWLALLAAAMVLPTHDALPSAASAVRFIAPLLDALAAAPDDVADVPEPALAYVLARLHDADAHAESLGFWLAHVGPIAALARELPRYVADALAVIRAPSFAPEALTRLRPAADVPSPSVLSPAAVCFVVRELHRRGVLDEPAAHPFCIVPAPPVRELLHRLGAPALAASGPERAFADARALWAFLVAHTDDPSAGRDYDLPLWWLAQEPDAIAALLGDAPLA